MSHHSTACEHGKKKTKGEEWGGREATEVNGYCSKTQTEYRTEKHTAMKLTKLN